MQYISVVEARAREGLRLVLTAGVPGPWGEAAKALVNYKEIPWVAVRQGAGGRNADLAEWTGQTSAPVAVYDDLPPVAHPLAERQVLAHLEQLRRKGCLEET